jgi:hypothetical protein
MLKMMFFERLLCAEQRTVNERECLGQLAAKSRRCGDREPSPSTDFFGIYLLSNYAYQ